MDFELSEEQKMIQKLARAFVTDELKPLERDLLGRTADLSDAKPDIDADTEKKLIQTARDAGLWGVNVPEKLGGVGLDVISSCIIEEELARTIVPFRFGDVTPLLYECNEQQKQKYLLPVLNNERQAYVALIEPGRDKLPRLQTTAEKTADGYILNGVKNAIGKPGGKYIVVVFADLKESSGPTCFLVEEGTPGLEVQIPETKKRQAVVPITINLKNCPVAREDLLGDEGQAFATGKKWLPARRIVRAARTAGICRRLLDEALIRVQTWQYMIRLISEQPATRRALAEIAAEIQATRLLVYQAAWKADKGDDARYEAAIAKLHTENAMTKVVNKIAQIYGGPADTSRLNTQGAPNNIQVSELLCYVISRNLMKGLI